MHLREYPVFSTLSLCIVEPLSLMRVVLIFADRTRVFQVLSIQSLTTLHYMTFIKLHIAVINRIEKIINGF